MLDLTFFSIVSLDTQGQEEEKVILPPFVLRLPYARLWNDFLGIVYLKGVGGKMYIVLFKVAIYLLVYRAVPKEPTQFGSVSGSEIHNLLFSISGIVSLYQAEPKEPT